MRVIDTFRTILSLAYSPCGRYLYSAGWQHVSRWDVYSGDEARIFHEQGSAYQQSVAVSPDGIHLGWVNVAGQRFHRANTRRLKSNWVHPLQGQPTLNVQASYGFLQTSQAIQNTDSLAVDPSGWVVAYVKSNGLFLRHTPQAPIESGRYLVHVNELANEPGYRVTEDRPTHFGFASRDLLWWHEKGDFMLHVVDTDDIHQVERPERLPIAVTPDGRTGIAPHQREVMLLDLSSGLVRERYNWDVGTVEAVAVAPDGLTVAVAGWAGGIAIFDLDG